MKAFNFYNISMKHHFEFFCNEIKIQLIENSWLPWFASSASKSIKLLILTASMTIVLKYSWRDGVDNNQLNEIKRTSI